jgi:WD40 repeat protein
MPLKYQFKLGLSRTHADSVHRLAFSPDGAYLASASSDRQVFISCAESGKVMHILCGGAAALCLSWAPTRMHELWCGFGNGQLIVVTVTKVSNRLHSLRQSSH